MWRLTLALVLSVLVSCTCKSADGKKHKGKATASAEASGAPSAAGWSTIGLDKSIVSRIAVDRKNPSNIFLVLAAGGAEKGMWRSKDAGKTWNKMGGGLPDRPGGFIIVHPQNGTVLANPGVEGIWRSTDGGDSWKQVSTDPGGSNGLFFHPTGNSAWTLTSQAGMWRSEDGGASWVHTKNQNLPLNQFVLGPIAFDGAKLYLGTDSHGVYVSTDNGDSWTQAASTGVPDSAGGGGMTYLDANPARPGVLFAHMRAGVFRSADSGATFTKLDLGGATPGYFDLVIDPANATTIFATASDTPPGIGGIIKSTDDGKSWTSIGPKNIGVNCVEVAPDGTVYAGTVGRGIWRLAK